MSKEVTLSSSKDWKGTQLVTSENYFPTTQSSLSLLVLGTVVHIQLLCTAKQT